MAWIPEACPRDERKNMPDLSGEKMSASIPDSNTDTLGPPELVQQKL